MRRLAATLVALPILAAQAAAQEPQVEPGRVIFPATGRVVRFEPHTIVHEDSEAAVAKGEAVEIRRSAEVIPAWKRVLLRSVSLLYEGSTEEIAVYDYSGKLIGSTRPYLGPVLLAPVEHRFFACEVSSHYGTTHAYIVGETGVVLSKIEHVGEPSDCFTTADQRFVVILHMVGRSPTAPTGQGDPLGAWNVVARVFDFNGKLIANLESDKKTTGFFEADGRRYEVALPEPAPPG